jgi:hypothetical protein
MVWELLDFEIFFVIENSINLKISLSSKPSFYSYLYLLLNVPKAGYKVPNFVPNGSNERFKISYFYAMGRTHATNTS